MTTFPAFAAELLPPPYAENQTDQAPIVQYLNEEELQRNFQQARKVFNPKAAEGGTRVEQHHPYVPPTPVASVHEVTPAPQQLISAGGVGVGSSRLPLKQVYLRLAYEDQTLADIMADIERLVRRQSGPWVFSWRLKDENKNLLNQRVSLNAESTFDVFLSHFVDRINNLTGTRLFIKVFEGSRIVVISDSF